jgi:transposase-like protein
VAQPVDKKVALAALAANDNNVKRTAKQLGMSHSTLRRWAVGAEPTPDAERNLLAQLKSVAWQLSNDLSDPEKRAKATLRDIAIALGVAMDKIERLENVQQGTDDPLLALIEAVRAH